MAKCPNCGAEIDKLEVVARGSISWNFSLNDSGYCEYDNMLIGDEFDGNTYYCPECDDELFTDEDDATDFLLGGGNE